MKIYASFFLILLLSLFAGKVEGQCTPPSITGQPSNQSTCPGSSVSFSVTATGDGLSYQWKKDGSDISGATGSTYTISSPAETDEGSYTVVVTGDCGTPVTSDAATLTVKAEPAITGQPANQITCPGSSVSFSVTATGDGLLYQWKKDGSDISGATSSTYTISSPAETDEGSYTVEVSGDCGTPVTSDAAALTVKAEPAITGQPANQITCPGSSVSFSVTATGDGLLYQWKKDGSDISGATSSTYTISSPAETDEGSYTVEVSGDCGTPVTSDAAALTVKAEPAITGQPSNQITCPGSSVSFSVTATGDGLLYQWKKDGSNISGATSSTYTISSPAETDEGSYTVVVSGDCGTPVTSTSATLTVYTLTGIPVFTEGDTILCNSTNDTYVATTTYGTISYSISPSGAGSINSSSGYVNWDNGFDGTAIITATATGVCGTETATRSVRVYDTAPSRPSAINGLTSVCQSQTDVIYSPVPVSSATYYYWEVSSGITILDGQGTSSLKVSFASGASSPQTVSVKSGNPCGLSSFRSLSVEVRPIPTASITPLTTTVCQGAASPQVTINNLTSRPVIVTYNINGASQTEIPVDASNHVHIDVGTSVPGTYTYTLVSVRYQTEASCSNLVSGTATVIVTPTVGTPTAITIAAGSDPVCQLTSDGITTTYSTTASNNTGFNWSLSNPAAGSINSSGVMTWANGFSGSVDIQVTAKGCNGPTSPPVTRTVNVTSTVGTPTAITISDGSEPTCQLTGATTTTYSTTASDNTGFNWSLSNSAAGSINTSGEIIWTAGFSGSVNIQVTAKGCNGPSGQVIRTVNITPTVGEPTPITISGGTEPICQLTNETTTTTYATTATNNIGFNWSLSNPAAGSIGLTTGVMTWADGFSGSVNIKVFAIGCSGNSSEVIRTVNITPAVGTPTPIAIFAGSDPTCQLTSGTTMTIYTTTATNSTGFMWLLSDNAAGSINASSGLMTWANDFSGNVNIKVTASGCGTSPEVTRTVTIHPLPVVTITGLATPRINSTGNLYETQAGMSGYSWSISGGGSGIPADNTFTVDWNTTGNQTISVNYIDTYGCTATGPTIFNVAVKPLPVATNALISGYPSVGNTLTGTYTYTDGSSGTDNSTFRWLRNGTDSIPFATANTYVPVTDDVNKTLTFEVTPMSSVGPPYTGSVIKSAATELVEDLTGMPVADEVCIEGIRTVDNVINGEYRYTFSKAEGLSTYRWLRRDTATGADVVISTNRQYTLVTADIDDSKEIIFEVTPVSSNLTPIPGNPVQSRPLARILIPKTEYSVSEADVILSSNEPGGVFSGTGVTGNIFSPSSAGSAGSPYTLTYLLNIVNTSSTCSQQASKIVTVNPNVTSFVGFDPFYCHDGGTDVITVSGVPSDATELDFILTDSDGIIAESGNSVTIDPGKMRPGVNKDILYFSYKRLGIFYRISKYFVIDSVGTEIRIINLDTAYCEGDAKEYVSVEGVYPAGGTADWKGTILSDMKPASAFADPSLGTPGETYPITYCYKSPIGCYSDTLYNSVTINPLPKSSFSLNPTYNIDGGPVTLIPVQEGGTFSGRGVSGDILFPDIAGLGEDEIKYSITDNNKCSATLGLKTIIRTAQGNFSGIPSVICYEDTTYNIVITNLPTTGILSITGFTSYKNSLVYTYGGTTAFYNVPAAGEGPDTLVFSYKWDDVDYSISKTLNVDSLGLVEIKNLAFGQIICDDRAPYELFPSIIGGVFEGPVSGSYLDPLKATRRDTVTYTYTNLKTGCKTNTVVPITVYPAPKVAFAPKDVCIEDSKDTTFFNNNTIPRDTIESWLWEFTDATGTKTSSLKDAGYLYSTGGLQKIALTATTVNGCSAKTESTFDFGKRPDADFYWRSDCLHPNDSIILRDTTKSTSLIVSRSWRLSDWTEFSIAEKEARYPKSDTGYLRIQYIVRTSYANCIDTVTKDIFIKPAITVPADGYFESFETGNGGWVKGEITGNTWSFGLPDRGVMNSAASGQNTWYTDFSITVPKQESSSIVSPCFNFAATERPLIKLNLMKRFTRDRDGASLQYRIGDNNEWRNVGAIDDGIEWYNSAVIRGAPGGNQLGWTTRGEPDTSWVESIHTLDELKGKSDVVFRIAYGSDGTTPDYEGLAFDDIWIGERSRNILLEHFTKVTELTSKIANALVDSIVSHRSEDVINIQYHTNFPGPESDPYYNSNPGDASARILFYGLTQAPYTFIDGGIQTDFAYTYSYANDNTKIDSTDIIKRSLIPSKFDISLNTGVFGGVLTINGKITALENISTSNLTLFLAVTEKKNAYTSPLGETEFWNVFRKFIPDAGGMLLKNNWTKGESITMEEQTWTINRIPVASDIEVIAFIQNTITKEVYQASSDIHPDIVVGIEDPANVSGNGFILYPNPAVNKLTIRFKEPLARETDIRIYDIRGVVISSYKAGSGITEFFIDDLNLKEGIYLVRISVKGIDLGFRKLVVSGD